MRVLTHDLGVSWVVEDEPLQRASHALVDDGRVWLVDPVEDATALVAVEALGEVVGVLQLLDRHPRANAALARQYGVPLHRLPDAVPDAPFDLFDVVSVPKWRERGLWWPARRALLVPEAVGTVPYFTCGAAPAGVHPMLRLVPPRGALEDYANGLEHLLCGHGEPLHGDAAADGLRTALKRSRVDAWRVPLAAVKGFSPVG